jgi:hypothetical protein
MQVCVTGVRLGRACSLVKQECMQDFNEENGHFECKGGRIVTLRTILGKYVVRMGGG